MLYTILSQCKDWAVSQGFHKQSKATQLKKISEELTEAFVHLSTNKSVDDDIGDILISMNTYNVIEGHRRHDIDRSIKDYATAIEDELLEARGFGGKRVKLSIEEWTKDYLIVMTHLYEDICPKASIIELALQLALFYADNKGRSIDAYIVDSYNEIKDRNYSNQFVKD